MDLPIGLLILLIAGFFQGSFILPATATQGWKWENTWFSFSLLGMVALNLLLAFLFVPNLLSVYRSVPVGDLLLLTVFGLCWGLGAVLFGIAMDRLGMALGYPVIMGLIASFGALVPLLIFHSGEVFTLKGATLFVGALVVIYGILLCTKAHVLKESSSETKVSKPGSGIYIAVSAGILSCLPNIGFSFGGSLVTAAQKAGASSFMAGNAVWALFFTMGFIPNAIYTVYLMRKNNSAGLFKVAASRNSFAACLMALMWIGSFYLYGISSIKLGPWGNIIGWPLFISLSIVTGNLWGMAKAEWTGSPAIAKLKLRQGMAVIFLAVIIIGVCNLL